MTNMEDEANGEDTRVTLPSHSPATSNPENINHCSLDINDSVPADLPKSDWVYCAGCQKPIFDKYYMWVDQRSWHEACVRCSVCGEILTGSCYSKNCKLYCQRDYKQLQQCRRCEGNISSNELVRKVSGHSFHVTCLTCDVCHTQLQSGDQYFIDGSTNQICCKICHDRSENITGIGCVNDDDSASDSERSDDEVFSQASMRLGNMSHLSNYDAIGMQHPHQFMRRKSGSKSSLSIMTQSGDGKRVKRPRTILTTAQRRKFKASFEVSQKPCRKIRETLATETGLSPRVVQVWFQNQRAKVKKLARRQTQGDGNGQGSTHGGARSRRKKTNDSDSDNEISSPGSYVSAPTPHQNSLYHDTYRSPGSIQTSPTTSTSETNPYFNAISSAPDAADIMYDDFDTNILSHDPSSDIFMAHNPHSATSSVATSSLNLDARLHIDVASTLSDFNNNSNPIGLDGDIPSGTSPHAYFPPQSMPTFPTQSSVDGNPIDKLMYMQNNFFQT